MFGNWRRPGFNSCLGIGRSICKGLVLTIHLRRGVLIEVTNELQWQALSQIDFDLSLVITTLPGNIEQKQVLNLCYPSKGTTRNLQKVKVGRYWIKFCNTELQKLRCVTASYFDYVITSNVHTGCD